MRSSLDIGVMSEGNWTCESQVREQVLAGDMQLCVISGLVIFTTVILDEIPQGSIPRILYLSRFSPVFSDPLTSAALLKLEEMPLPGLPNSQS